MTNYRESQIEDEEEEKKEEKESKSDKQSNLEIKKRGKGRTIKINKPTYGRAFLQQKK